jgi:sulfur-carrier protein adenylyltransferase/sulfurtransferase
MKLYSVAVFTQDEKIRYARHFQLPGFGEDGQRKLKGSRVLVIGMGGLGSPASIYLAAAGVGLLGLADWDKVETSNLQRQILYTDLDIGTPKLEAAKLRLKAMNPNTEVNLHDGWVDSGNLMRILEGYDLVVDGTDNFNSRYLINDACVFSGKPTVYGSIRRFDAQVSVFSVPEGPCYRCLFPKPPKQTENCAEAGVLGVLPGIVGAIQATEAIKILAGIGDSLVGRLLVLDALRMSFREIRLRKDPSCELCGINPVISDLSATVQDCGNVNGKPNMPNINVNLSLTPRELKDKLDKKEDFLLVDVRDTYESSVASIGGHLIPLVELGHRHAELDPKKEIVVYCHHGVRSLSAVNFLKSLGFEKVHNLSGGIDRWSIEVDPTIARY